MVLLIGILVASASAILLNAMRIFCQNVIMFNAQSKALRSWNSWRIG
ncbi:MAG: hypothetical protein ACLT3Y_01770 [Ruminococcus callidus]